MRFVVALLEKLGELWPEGIAGFLVRSLTGWALTQSAKYAVRRLRDKSSGSPKDRTRLVAPDPSYVQGLLAELLEQQQIWKAEGKPQVEVLLRTVVWGFSIMRALVGYSLENLRSLDSNPEDEEE